jgi:FkbM family methyltransferase
MKGPADMDVAAAQAEHGPDSRTNHSVLKNVIRNLLPRSRNPHRIWSGRLKGHQIVTSWHDYPAAIVGYAEAPLLAWFAGNVHAGETWLDIGAHYGLTAIALCNLVGREGRVFAFEPMQTSAASLTETRRLNTLSQLSILPMGLGSSQSLETRNLPAGRGMIDCTLLRPEWEETLLVAQFDWLWPRLAGTSLAIHGVKIDVQGMELEVIRGMAGCLSRWKPKLALEFHRGVNRNVLVSTLVECGYQMPGKPIDKRAGQVTPVYQDNCSYVFEAN